MSFRGTPNLNGRKVGSKNKVSSEVKGMIAELVDGESRTFKERLENLSDKDYCQIYIQLMRFVLPTMKSIDIPVVQDEFPFQKVQVEIIGR